MSYVVPTTRSDGYVVDASEWNKNTVDNPIALKALIDAIGTANRRVCDGRLTLTSGTPVTTSDVTAATTLYFTPYAGSQIALYDGSSAWSVIAFTELSIAVPATTSQMYDVFVYSNSGTATLELTAWTNDTTRATALTTQNGVLVKTGATTRRYVGSFRTTTVSGQTEDSATKRFVSNYYNREHRPLYRVESTASWNYTTATWRQANAATANKVEIVQGVAEEVISLQVDGFATNSSGNIPANIGIGEDSTSSPVTSAVGVGYATTANDVYNLGASLVKVPAVGYHYYAWLEASAATGTTTWFGANGSTVGSIGLAPMGLRGWIEG